MCGGSVIVLGVNNSDLFASHSVVLCQLSSNLLCNFIVIGPVLEILQQIKEELLLGLDGLFTILPNLILGGVDQVAGVAGKGVSITGLFLLINNGQVGGLGSSAAGHGSGNCNSGSGQSGKLEERTTRNVHW